MLSITMLPCSIGGNCLLSLYDRSFSTNLPSTPVEYTASAISLDASIEMDSAMNSRTDNVTSSEAVTRRFTPDCMATDVLWHVQHKIPCARFGTAVTIVALSSGADADDSGTAANVSDGIGRCCRSRWWRWYGGRVGGIGCIGVAAKISAYEMIATSPWSTGMHMSKAPYVRWRGETPNYASRCVTAGGVRAARVDGCCSTNLSRVAQRALAEEKTTVSMYPTLSETAAPTTAIARRSIYTSAIIKFVWLAISQAYH